MGRRLVKRRTQGIPGRGSYLGKALWSVMHCELLGLQVVWWYWAPGRRQTEKLGSD